MDTSNKAAKKVLSKFNLLDDTVFGSEPEAPAVAVKTNQVTVSIPETSSSKEIPVKETVSQESGGGEEPTFTVKIAKETKKTGGEKNRS